MSKHTKELFVFEGRLLEGDSILEIRSGTTDEEWAQLVKDTVEFYCLFRVGKDLGPVVMEHNDSRVFRRLKKTMELIKKIDPMIMLQYNVDKMIEENIKQAKEGWDEIQQTIRVAYEADRKASKGDIHISSL